MRDDDVVKQFGRIQARYQAEEMAKAAGLVPDLTDTYYSQEKARRDAKRRLMVEESGFGLFDATAASTIADFSQEHVRAPLIENVIPRDSIGMLFADSYVGKSYVAPDWGLSIATGQTHWAGRPVTQGRVLYAAMEGANSLQSRWEAWEQYNGVSLASCSDFILYPKVVDFMAKDSVSMMADYVEGESIDLIIIDMSTQAMGGADENSPQDSGHFMRELARVKESNPGATALFLHHTRKDNPKQYFGSKNFYGGSDFAWCMSRIDLLNDADPFRLLECTKYRADAGSKPEQVHLEFLRSGPDSVLEIGTGSDIDLEELAKLISTSGPPTQADLARHVAKRTGKAESTVKNRISKRVLSRRGMTTDTAGRVVPAFNGALA